MLKVSTALRFIIYIFVLLSFGYFSFAKEK